VLALWALVVRRFRIPAWVLIVSVILEIAIRSALLLTAGEYIAYMLFPNWMTVFLLGTWFGQREASTSPAGTATRSDRLGLAFYPLLLAAFAVGWAFAVRPHMLEYSFPFMRLSSADVLANALVTAGAVSVVYVCYTLLVFHVVRRVAAPAAVRFVARNTLVVFIAHMPIFYALDGAMKRLAFPYLERASIQILVCLVGLVIVSEIVRRVVQPTAVREWLGARIARFFHDPAAEV
jgi:fucose 4-O-acetylase-like acetyltransferase